MSNYRQLLGELIAAANDTPPRYEPASAAQCSLLAVLLEREGMPSDMVISNGYLTKANASDEIDALKRSK